MGMGKIGLSIQVYVCRDEGCFVKDGDKFKKAYTVLALKGLKSSCGVKIT